MITPKEEIGSLILTLTKYIFSPLFSALVALLIFYLGGKREKKNQQFKLRQQRLDLYEFILSSIEDIRESIALQKNALQTYTKKVRDNPEELITLETFETYNIKRIIERMDATEIYFSFKEYLKSNSKSEAITFQLLRTLDTLSNNLKQINDYQSLYRNEYIRLADQYNEIVEKEINRPLLNDLNELRNKSRKNMDEMHLIDFFFNSKNRNIPSENLVSMRDLELNYIRTITDLLQPFLNSIDFSYKYLVNCDRASKTYQQIINYSSANREEMLYVMDELQKIDLILNNILSNLRKK